MEFLAFIDTHANLIQIILYVIVAVILACKSGDNKILKEVLSILKYRVTGSAEATKDSMQSFSRIKPVYRLNKATNELEKTEETVDITEIANSCKDFCMQAVLERFFPTEGSQENVLQEQVDLMADDLDIMKSSFDLAETYRQKFNLPLEMSVNDIFTYVGNQAKVLKSKLKEQEENAKKNVEESE